jgi:hypothetical protein
MMLKKILILIAVVLVTSIVITCASRWHDRRIEEGFYVSYMNGTLEGATETKSDGIEGFAEPVVANPASYMHNRKTAAYLDNGIAQFFSSDNDMVRETTKRKYLLSFYPTVVDLACDFTTVKANNMTCTGHLDSLTQFDTLLVLPQQISGKRYATLSTIDQANDTMMSVTGSLYAMSCSTLQLSAFAVPSVRANFPRGSSRANSFELTMPSSDCGTQAFYLIRPMYVRAANLAGTPTSTLYRVVWSTAQTYDSNGAVQSTVLLTAVTPFLEQSRTLADISKATSRMKQVGHKDLSGSPREPFVCYYPKYKSLDPLIDVNDQATMQSVATLVTSLKPGMPAARVVDAYNNPVVTLSYSVYGGSSVTVVAGGKQFTAQIPPGGAAVAVVCVSYDSVRVACMTAVSTYITGGNLREPISYQHNLNTPPIGRGLPGELHTIINSRAIPCFADVAVRLGCLTYPRMVGVGGDRRGSVMNIALEPFDDGGEAISPYDNPDGVLLASSEDVLAAGESLAPGMTLKSKNGKFVLTFLLDGDLMVVESGTGRSVWRAHSRSDNPGMATLGADGVLRLFPTAAHGKSPYWESQDGPNPADQAPYRMEVDDEGGLAVSGKYGTSSFKL